MSYTTRSERHQKVQKQNFFSRKKLLPLVGVSLVAIPTVTIASSQQVQAEEIQAGATNAYNLINQIGWSAQQIASSNDLYASVMIAQALLESGNGTSLLSSAPYHNLFGIKGYNQESAVWLPTQEYVEGQWQTVNEPFRTYNSYSESLQDHAAILKGTSFTSGKAHYKGAWKSQTASYYDATAYLTGRYATDPDYNQKLNWLIATYDLTRFDVASQTIATSSEETSKKVASNASSATHIVAAGDTLWDIANRYGISIDQLMSNNGLSTDLIVVGQQLVV